MIVTHLLTLLVDYVVILINVDKKDNYVVAIDKYVNRRFQ